jgi:hypothetical protein
MQADAAALHGGANCLLWGQEEIVSVNAVDYARINKVVCGKKATVNGGTASLVTCKELRQDGDKLMIISSLPLVAANLVEGRRGTWNNNSLVTVVHL